jgi:hypothetical protein
LGHPLNVWSLELYFRQVGLVRAVILGGGVGSGREPLTDCS